jgi:glycosyltransferase involved in cell wall biosynthesis
MTVVSVIIPLYNGVEYLEECVRSVIAQTFTDWEVLIGVNGHGYDGGEVAPIAYRIASLDSRINVFIQPPPLRGKIESSHDLVLKSKAGWICMLDCDDKWEPTKLEKQLEASRTVAKNAVVIGTFSYYFGELTGVVPIPAGLIHPSELQHYNPIVNSSAMIQREYCMWKDEDLEDYSLWMNISLQGKDLYNVPELLTWHRIHTTSAFNSKHVSNVPLRTWYSQLYKQMVQ